MDIQGDIAQVNLVPLERRLIDRFQRDFPLCARPYLAIAEELGATEAEVMAALARLRDTGALSRIGAVVHPNVAGASTLAAMAVPPQELAAVAEIISAYPEVNHNYEREHRFNLWFVVTAPDAESRGCVLERIATETGHRVLDLPLEAAYHIDLGFPLS